MGQEPDFPTQTPSDAVFTEDVNFEEYDSSPGSKLMRLLSHLRQGHLRKVAKAVNRLGEIWRIFRLGAILDIPPCCEV